MRRLRAEIARYAPRAAPVLILGETGCGKDLVARALHALGKHPSGPFVAANVSCFRSELLASELFGHERGAFTGAVARRKGLFEEAHGGTIFLDEIGELPLELQPQLLRVLETGEVRAVGSDRVRRVNVRLVAATNRELPVLVRDGEFRADLFYRLHALVIDVLPLRRRMEDLPLLVAHLLERLRPEVGERSLDPEALPFLQRHAWPGNVRELLHVLQRAAIKSDNPELTIEDIADAMIVQLRSPSMLHEAAAVSTIEAVLKANGGRIAPSARKLGVARSTLRSHIRRHGIAIEP